MNIKIYRKEVATIELPLQSATFTRNLQGEHTLVFSLQSPDILDLHIGDTLTYKGEVMTINKAPIWTRSHVYKYDIRFEGHRHSLERWLLMDEGALTFDYFGSLEEYTSMFLERLNSVDSGWTADFDKNLDPVLVSFDEIDCYSALNDIAEAFGCEWDIVGKKITIKKTIGRATALEFSYGRGNGLYELTRKRIDNSKIVTRAYATGGSQNLPVGYEKRKLTLDGYLEDADAITAYGLREGVVNDEEIFPSRTGQATSVGKINDGTFFIKDSSIDFDLNGQRIDGSEASIVFKSGSLSGQQFKILSYNHSTKEIRYEANKDGNGSLIPAGSTVAEVGDYYTLVGIRMPQSYVTAALIKLAEKREEYLESNKAPRVLYGLNIDILNLKRLSVEPQAGDIIRVMDADNGIDEKIRVTSVSYPATFPDVLETGMQFTAEIGNEVTYTRVQKIEKDVKETRKIVTQKTRESIEEDRVLAMRMRQLQNLVFDPDGYFDGSKIKPNSIETLMLSVGAKSQNFMLNGVRVEVNYNNNPQSLKISSGQLIHLEVSIDGLGYIWNISELVKNDLVSGKPYYVSARCSRTNLSGTWHVSETPVGTEDENGFYHFNVGVIYSEFDGRRDYSFTSGMTYINGAQITTGKIDAARLNVSEIVVSGGGATVEQMNNTKQEALDAVDTALKDAKNYSDGLISSLGDLAHEDLVELAKLGSTIVQGGYIKAELIDVVSIFAQSIDATNLNVTGNSTIGDFEIDPDGLKYFYSQTAGNSTLFRLNYGNLIWEQLLSVPSVGSGTARFKAGTPGTNEGIVNVESTENHTANKGIKINMQGSNKRAIEVNKGKSYFGDDVLIDVDNANIYIGSKSGLSGTYEYNRGGGIWELEFEKGILVGQRLVTAG